MHNVVQSGITTVIYSRSSVANATVVWTPVVANIMTPVQTASPQAIEESECPGRAPSAGRRGWSAGYHRRRQQNGFLFLSHRLSGPMMVAVLDGEKGHVRQRAGAPSTMSVVNKV
jgi:hypothetical protein